MFYNSILAHFLIPLIAPQPPLRAHSCYIFPHIFGTQCTSQGPTVQHLRPRAPPELTASTRGTGVWLPILSTGIGVLLPNVSLWGLAANQAQHEKKTHQGTQQKRQPSSCASDTKGSRRLSAKSFGPSATAAIPEGCRTCWAPHPHPCRDRNATGTTLTLPLSAIRTHVGTDAPMRGQHLGHIQPPPTARATRQLVRGKRGPSRSSVIRGKRCGLWEESGQVPARDDNACPAALDPRYI